MAAWGTHWQYRISTSLSPALEVRVHQEARMKKPYAAPIIIMCGNTVSETKVGTIGAEPVQEQGISAPSGSVGFYL
jgi:hypothetical protein